MKILLVDDSQYTLAALSNMLNQAGHQVVACPSVEDAMREFSATTFDLLITDIMMKDLNQDGTKMAQFVKRKDAKFPVIAITSGLEFDRSKYIDYVNKFVDETLLKGFSKEALIDAINRVMAKKAKDSSGFK